MTTLTTLAFSAFAMDTSNLNAIKKAVSEETIRRSCSNALGELQSFVKASGLKENVQEALETACSDLNDPVGMQKFLEISSSQLQKLSCSEIGDLALQKLFEDPLAWGPYKGKLELQPHFFTGSQDNSDFAPSTPSTLPISDKNLTLDQIAQIAGMIREALGYGILQSSNKCMGVVKKEIAKGFLSATEAFAITDSVFMTPELQELIPSVVSQEIGGVLSEKGIIQIIGLDEFIASFEVFGFLSDVFSDY